MDEAGGFGYSCVGHVLQGHVVQEEVGQFSHGHHLLANVSHWVVAQIETGHLWQSGYREGEVRIIRMGISSLLDLPRTSGNCEY